MEKTAFALLCACMLLVAPTEAAEPAVVPDGASAMAAGMLPILIRMLDDQIRELKESSMDAEERAAAIQQLEIERKEMMDELQVISRQPSPGDGPSSNSGAPEHVGSFPSIGWPGIPGMIPGMGMQKILSMIPGAGMAGRPVAFTPERVVGADPEWPWATVEIGFKGYGDKDKWSSYSSLTDWEYSFLNVPDDLKDTPPINEPDPQPLTEQERIYLAEPDKTLPVISSYKKWPTAYLPSGLPVYPGSALEVEAKPGDVFGTVYDTSTDALMKYLDALRNAGWEIDADYGDFESIRGNKGLWFFQCSFNEGEALFQFMYNSNRPLQKPGRWP